MSKIKLILKMVIKHSIYGFGFMLLTFFVGFWIGLKPSTGFLCTTFFAMYIAAFTLCKVDIDRHITYAEQSHNTEQKKSQH